MLLQIDDLKSAIAASPYFDPLWYCERYPEVVKTGLTALDHYARFGIHWNRDPGPSFSCAGYLAANSDVAKSKRAAFEHFLFSGRYEHRKMGVVSKPLPSVAARLRFLLETGGMIAHAQSELTKIALGDSDQDGLLAQEILAIWALGQKDAKTSVTWFEKVEQRLGSANFPEHLRSVFAIALFAIGKSEKAQHLVLKPDAIDTVCAGLNGCHSIDQFQRVLDHIFSISGLQTVKLDAKAVTVFDALNSRQIRSEQVVEGNPAVSVILTAFNAQDTIETAIWSILSQTLSNFELIVVDDNSSDQTAEIVYNLAQKDPRIILIRLQSNQGAYACRNMALRRARGTFVTLMDADDWSHPDRLAFQCRHLSQNRALVGIMVGHLRVDSNLHVTRWTGQGDLVHEAVASFMFRKDVMTTCFGSWDTILVSADSELIRRMRHKFGERSIRSFPKLPYLFQRDTTQAVTRHPKKGMNWFYYGARREYYAAQLYHHKTAASLFYDGTLRSAFPVPALLLEKSPKDIVVDQLFIGHFDIIDSQIDSIIEAITATPNLNYGLVHVDRLDGYPAYIHPKLRPFIAKNLIKVICFGQSVKATRIHYLLDKEQLEMCHLLPNIQNLKPSILPRKIE